ncbi:MAG: hypothetical protein KA955_04985 [Prevotella sp.]|nr:hypothetical protein [Prevotella sp.]
MKAIINTLFLSLFLFACSNNSYTDKAEALLNDAKAAYNENKYDAAVSKIDSIRKEYPKAIEIRKEALALYQNIELKKAQIDLEHTDKLVTAINNEYNIILIKVNEDKKALCATAGELQELTLKKLKRDSIKTRFDILCAKIHYIHKLQKTK